MSSSYIALLPTNIKDVVLPADSHLTLAFMEETSWNKTAKILEQLVPMFNDLGSYKISGFARFRTPKNDALVALVDPGTVLGMLRQQLVYTLLDTNSGCSARLNSWIAHITLGYVEHNEKVDAPSMFGTVEFNKLRFKEKDSRNIKEWDLSNSLKERIYLK